MIVAHGFADRDVGVFGLARTGASAARSLIAGGARVHAWDDEENARAAVSASGSRIMPFVKWPWERIKTLVLSPGVPLTHPEPHAVVRMARDVGAEVIGDMELFARAMCGGSKNSNVPIIAITGTNGKSTTTALIGHILSSCGYAAEVGGNIGKPVLDLAPPASRTAYVLEVSSYQIELSPSLAPDVAVLTNISPDHLDRHGSLENYATVKARLLEQTLKTGQVCIGVDDPKSAAIRSRFVSNGGPDVVPVSVGKVLGRGIFVLDGVLYDSRASHAAKVLDLSSAAHLPGAHNWQNAALAYAATHTLVKDARAIAEAIVSFPGLAHRLEDVGRIGKVRFVNDSKATNADATERALVCFDDIFWIAGGREKEGGIESLKPFFSRIRKAYLIGEAARRFAKTLDDVPHEVSGSLEAAVVSAYSDARTSKATAPVVLLSPACASFDQFRDYEARGDAFRALVAELAAPAVKEAS
ncbi:MAG TPA: UDP-N-acetylmuramoyl-L-alanine--D-glutamate ligase [Rhizomicrobium sp.]|jgi:UDP-N-acetylmuramoylalanine--D-glutamate ligase